MFGLFKKKVHRIPVTDRIWMNQGAKWKACAAQYRQDHQTVFMGWFEDSRNNLKHYLETESISGATIMDAGFATMPPGNGPVVFIEHHPLQQEEQLKFAALGLEEAIVYSSLDEALFLFFGGERIAQLMRQMGMTTDDMVTHGMITAAIKRAQEKIADKAIISGSARSQADWLINAGISGNEHT